MESSNDVAEDGVMNSIFGIVYPAVRLLLAGVTVWYSSGASAYVSASVPESQAQKTSVHHNSLFSSLVSSSN